MLFLIPKTLILWHKQRQNSYRFENKSFINKKIMSKSTGRTGLFWFNSIWLQ